MDTVKQWVVVKTATVKGSNGLKTSGTSIVQVEGLRVTCVGFLFRRYSKVEEIYSALDVKKSERFGCRPTCRLTTAVATTSGVRRHPGLRAPSCRTLPGRTTSTLFFVLR